MCTVLIAGTYYTLKPQFRAWRRLVDLNRKVSKLSFLSGAYDVEKVGVESRWLTNHGLMRIAGACKGGEPTRVDLQFSVVDDIMRANPGGIQLRLLSGKITYSLALKSVQTTTIPIDVWASDPFISFEVIGRAPDLAQDQRHLHVFFVRSTQTCG